MGVFTDYVEGKLADWIQKPFDFEIAPLISMTFQYGYGTFEGQAFKAENGDMFLMPLLEPEWFNMMPADFKESLPYKAALMYFMESSNFVETKPLKVRIELVNQVVFCRGKELPFAPQCFDTGVFASVTWPTDNGEQKKLYIPAQIIRPPKKDSK